MVILIAALIIAAAILVVGVLGERMRDRLDYHKPILKGRLLNSGVHETQVRTWVGQVVYVEYARGTNLGHGRHGLLLKWGKLGLYLRDEDDPDGKPSFIPHGSVARVDLDVEGL